MTSLLVRNARVLVTMDDARTELAGGEIYAEDGWIRIVGIASHMPSSADVVVDAAGCVVLPGLVNTHHHLYQTLTRALPGAQNSGLFEWLATLYPVWGRLTPEHVRVATMVGLAELALSGCTTAFDHQYLWPGGSRLDDQMEGADTIGIRFHGSRGSMSVGVSQGGLPPDDLVEDEDTILEDSARLIGAYHDGSPGSMRQVVLAPCSPFSVSPGLMRRTAALARSEGVRLHTHLAETADEEAYCRSAFGLRPVEYAADTDWLGEDVWFAHAVHVDAAEQALMAGSATGVAHCPTSNMRLASGIAPVAEFLRLGVAVGLGVDGSASNDGSHLLAEARQAMLLARLATSLDPGGGPQMTARQALELATRGGATVLGRTDIGSLEAGKAADLIAIDVDDLAHSGFADPVAGIVFASPGQVRHSIVHGRQIVEDGALCTIDVEELAAVHRRLAADLVA